MKEAYVALSGAVAREKQLTLVSNNLANVNTVGFKKEVAVYEVRPPETDFAAMMNSYDPGLRLPEPPRQWVEGDRSYVRIAESFLDVSPGILRPTDRKLDVAIESPNWDRGAAFFEVATPDGLRYTRAGNFYVNSSKDMVTGAGYAVLDTEGKTIKLDDTDVEIRPGGEIRKDGVLLATLKLAYFEHPENLEKEGYSVFSDREGTVEQRDLLLEDMVSVKQGHLEMGNVNIVEELTRMIELQRAYGTHQKTLQTMNDLSSQVISQVMSG